MRRTMQGIGKQAGVSVVEAVMALFMIGVVWEITLQSQTLFNAMLSRRLAAEMRDVETMVRLYRDRYGALPGDDAGAAARFPGAIDGAPDRPRDNGRIEHGAADHGTVATAPITASEADEGKLFWNHVRHAGLARGDPAEGFSLNAVNGRLFVTSEDRRPDRPAGVRAMHAVCSSRVDGDVARRLDLATDDGDATRGRVWAARESLRDDIPNAVQDVTFARVPTPYEAGHTYTVCKGF